MPVKDVYILIIPNLFTAMKRRVCFIAALLFTLTLVKAAYFENLPYTIKQPDGTTIDCFVTGDEFYNWIHDVNGYTIIQAPDGYFYYAEQDGDLVKPSKYLVNSVDPASVGLSKWIKISKPEFERRKSERDRYLVGITEPEYAPQTGTFNNLVIYIRFSDESEFTVTRQTYDNSFNPESGVSLKSYFKEVSYNNLTISSTHYPACNPATNLSFQDSHPRAYFQPYNESTNPIGYTNDTELTEREHQLLADAVNWININSPVPGTINLDGDLDGRVDNVCFIVRGNSGGWAELLWAHRWSLYSQTVYINGKRVYGYTFQPENQVAVKTLCHEMFHALGSPDLYHYNNQGVINPVGYWDLMEYGGGHMLTYMKWKYSNYNWIASIPEITTSGTYTLNPVTSSVNNCFKIASPYSTDEYFIAEYRNKSGTFETNIPGSGLIVYRVDTRLNGNAYGPPDEVYVYRPDGTPTTNGTPNNAYFSSAAGRTAINDATNPSSFLQNGGVGGLDISNVTSAGTTISFHVSFPTPCTPPTNQATSLTFSDITTSTMTAGWNRGNGDAVLVLAREGGPVTTGPVNGETYSGNEVFGYGSQIGEGNFVVYNGGGASISVSGLKESTVYYFALYEYTNGNWCYNANAATGSAVTSGYCVAGSTDTQYEYISNVETGTVNLASGRGTGGYENHTDATATVQIGVNTTATITVTNPYDTDQIIIWIDWNQDEDFDDPDENVYSSNGTFINPHTTGTFSPPAGTTAGLTRMRIRLHDSGYYGNATPCGNSYYGEVEDYSIIIISGSNLTTTAATGITKSSAVSGGNITNDGGSAVTTRGVCWSTSTNPTVDLATKTLDGAGSGSFTSNISGLTAGVIYYVRAYATNGNGTAYGNEIIFSTYNADAVTDIDGNYYNTVTIGSQVWLAENLKTTKLNNGLDIQNVIDAAAWSGLSTPAYRWYDNDIHNKNIYGALYNWYTVNTNNLCPSGWHVPSEADWTILIDYLGGQYIAGGKLKEAGTTHWQSPNVGATNESGFTALPGGTCLEDGAFINIGTSGYWWSSTEDRPGVSVGRQLNYYFDAVDFPTFYNQDGLSVRCVKNENVSNIDSLALVSLYNETNGPNWTIHNNWLAGPVNTWFGVSVESGRVTQLDLGTNNLTGTIPPEIGDLTQLISLVLGANNISGNIPEELYNLTALNYLHLGNNQLSGEISTSIAKMTDLHQLILWYNQLSGSIPNEINQTSIEYLFLNDNQFTGLPVLEGLSNLVGLRIYNNFLTFEDIEPNIGKPSTYFQYTPQSNIGEELSIQLQVGDGYSMNVVCGGSYNQYQWYRNSQPIPGALSATYAIPAAAIPDAGDYNCQVTNTLVTGLTLSSRPVHISIYDPAIVTDSLALVAFYHATGGPGWTNRDNWLTGPLSSWYGITITDQRVTGVYMNQNNLTGSIPPEIGDLTGLTTLNLNRNQLTGNIPAAIGNLIKLNYCVLGENQLTGSIPPELFNMVNLEQLYLNNNHLSGTIPPGIGNLTHVSVLNVESNQLSGALPAELGNLINLFALYLDNNLFTGSIPSGIRNLVNLAYMQIDNCLFDDLPVLNTLEALGQLYIGSNRFTFEDIEPNIGIPDYFFGYAPQANIGEEQSIQLSIGDFYNLNVVCGGDHNQYQWYRNSQPISGAQSATYAISGAALADAGDYYCEVTNTVATSLAIYSNPFHVSVNSNADQQEILLQNGWNLISLHLSPENTSLLNLVQPLIDEGSLVKVQDESGRAIEAIPGLGTWLNDIGSWSMTEGYKIRVNQNTTLNVNGISNTGPVYIPLTTGWNIFSYPFSTPQAAMTVLSELISSGSLMKVQDETGDAIEPLPENAGWIDNIGDFEPGEGYKIRVSGDAVLIINPPGTGGLKSARPEPLVPQHFKAAWEGNGYDHMNVYLTITSNNASVLQPGDEIAVYDGPLCVGATVFQNQHHHQNLLSVSISNDDPATETKDGFTAGNTMSFKIWKAADNSEISMGTIDYLTGYSSVFEPLGTTVAGVNLPGDAVDAWTTSLGDNYPNPFSAETTIPYTLCETEVIELAIYDVLGQRVTTLVKSTQAAGSYEIIWDGANNNHEKVKPGIYFCRLVAGKMTVVKTILLIH
jgi:M6 family metalloprotease-like protein/uncharacterized protein (TIGR02145 family)